MKCKDWIEIYNRIKKEHPHYGGINLGLTWHDGRLSRYTFTTTDTTILRVEEIREKKNERH